jgi:hypothetical protein
MALRQRANDGLKGRERQDAASGDIPCAASDGGAWSVIATSERRVVVGRRNAKWGEDLCGLAASADPATVNRRN